MTLETGTDAIPWIDVAPSFSKVVAMLTASRLAVVWSLVRWRHVSRTASPWTIEGSRGVVELPGR